MSLIFVFKETKQLRIDAGKYPAKKGNIHERCL